MLTRSRFRTLSLVFATLVVVVVAVVLALTWNSARPQAADASVGLECPSIATVMGTGTSVTCTVENTIIIDAVNNGNGTFSCRQGSFGAPTAASPVCSQTVRVAIMPTLTCDNRSVTIDLNLGQTPTNGNDVIFGTLGNDIIDALGGNDVVCGWLGDDVINGGAGNDRIFGGVGNDFLQGGQGNDVVRGEWGNDTILG